VLVGAGVGAAGAAAVHPSALVTIGITAVAYLAVDVLRRGRRDLRRVVRAFWPAAVVAAVVAVPTLALGLGAVAKTTSFDSQTPHRPVALAVGKALTFAYGGYLDPDSSRSQMVAAALVLAGLVVLLVARRSAPLLAAYVENAVAARFATPDFTRVNGDDEAAAAWLAGQVRPGQRVLNSANDGSTILYTEYGLPVVNLATLGSATAPYTYQLLGGFRDYPTDPVVRRDLLDLHVDWLYVDSQAPAIGVGGAPFAWPQADRLTVPRGFEDLAGLPGLTPVFRAGTVTVYHLDPAVIARL
jgi:hypothetical protein